MYVLGCSGGAEGWDRCGVCVVQYLRVIILLHNTNELLWGILPIFIIIVVVVGIICNSIRILRKRSVGLKARAGSYARGLPRLPEAFTLSRQPGWTRIFMGIIV